MDIRRYIFKKITQTEKDYDETDLKTGINLFCTDNAFDELEGKYSDSVIEQIVDTSLNGIISLDKTNMTLFFSNYELIEKIRLLDNKALNIAHRKYKKECIDDAEVDNLEKEFDILFKRCASVEGLADMLKFQTSETILNIDYCRGKTEQFSRRLRDIAGSAEVVSL